MRCDDASALIDAFAEDALDEAERAPFVAHLATCPRCREAVEASRRLSLTLAALPVAHPSPAADARALAAVAEERAWSAWRARMRRRLVVAGSVAAAVAVAAALFVVTPAASWFAERTPEMTRIGESWLRFRAVPALEASQGTLVAALAGLAAVAVMERVFAATSANGARFTKGTGLRG